MELQLEKDPLGYRVGSFVDNTVVIGEARYKASLIVTPKQVVNNWPPQHPNQLTIDDIGMILILEPELIIVGIGNKFRFPDSAILQGENCNNKNLCSVKFVVKQRMFVGFRLKP